MQRWVLLSKPVRKLRQDKGEPDGDGQKVEGEEAGVVKAAKVEG